jgi:hypothetical protein
MNKGAGKHGRVGARNLRERETGCSSGKLAIAEDL